MKYLGSNFKQSTALDHLHLSTGVWILIGAWLLCGCGSKQSEAADNSEGSNSFANTRESEQGSQPQPIGQTSDPQDLGNTSESEDSYCRFAWDGLAGLDEYGELINELSLTVAEVPKAKLNENGELAVEQSQIVQRSLQEANAFVVDSNAKSAFDDLLNYERRWMRPQALLAAGASDDSSYGELTLDLITSDGVAESVGTGAIASGVIVAYTLERCEAING